jgi:hypothetical protein
MQTFAAQTFGGLLVQLRERRAARLEADRQSDAEVLEYYENEPLDSGGPATGHNLERKRRPPREGRAPIQVRKRMITGKMKFSSPRCP